MRALNALWLRVRKPTVATQHDQARYDRVAEELAANNLKPGLWTRAIAETGCEDGKARARYIQLRVAELANSEDCCPTTAADVAPRKRPARQGGPSGVGGWLLFFCVWLTILSPLGWLGRLLQYQEVNGSPANSQTSPKSPNSLVQFYRQQNPDDSSTDDEITLRYAAQADRMRAGGRDPFVEFPDWAQDVERIKRQPAMSYQSQQDSSKQERVQGVFGSPEMAASVVELFFSFCIMVGGLAIGLQIWSGDARGRKRAREYLSMRFGVMVVVYLFIALLLSVGPAEEDGIRVNSRLLGAVVGAILFECLFYGVWWNYLKRSKRVRNTYRDEDTTALAEVKPGAIPS
jgi:hypothetical protein